jgi:16S rRNA (guanine(966)-N(2))-methyltransferase RsmD
MSLRLSGGRRLQSPPGATARPTPSRLRLAVMNMLATELPGARWLDLFSGSGVMGCEALQRGAAAVVAVDQDRQMAATSRANLEAVARGLAGRAQGPEQRPAQVEVVQQEVLRWLQAGAGQRGQGRHWNGGFQLIYADPPYAAGLHGPVARAVAAGGWLAPGGELLLECASSAVPEVPESWLLHEQRRYGSSTLLRLRQEG